MKRTKLRIKEVKRNAKSGLGNYYGKAAGATALLVIITFVIMIAAMIPMFSIMTAMTAEGMNEYTQTEALVGQTQTIDTTSTETVMDEETAQMLGAMGVSYPLMFAAIFLVLAPLQLGYYRFFLRARQGDAKVGTLFSFFKKGYWRSIGYYVLYMLKTYCWALLGYLMIIPGMVLVLLSEEPELIESSETLVTVGAVLLVVGMIGMFILLFNKAYKYMMGMYALADNPEMRVSDAFRVGKIVAKRNVGRLFWLQVSYFFWYLLASLVPYAGQILVMPLVQAGMTEGYVFLKSAAIDRGELSAADFPQLAAGESSELVAANGETAVAEN